VVGPLIEAMKLAIQEMRAWPGRNIQIFHHNDADGLCSGAILTRAFERAGFEVHRFCLEKPYPEVLEKIYEQKGAVLVFADFAGRIAPILSNMNKGRNLTLILDHHVAEAPTDPRVHNLDPELYGLKGDRDIAAATTCFLFASALNEANRDLAYLGALGAVGDKFFVDGRLVSQNRAVTQEAVQQGTIEIREHETGEQYILKRWKRPMPCDDLGRYLDVLGGAGYYEKGPEMGIRVCLEGTSSESDQMVRSLKQERDKRFSAEVKSLRKRGLSHTRHIQWFHVKNRFSPMGVKMIGLFCETIKGMDFVDPRKYIAGFQRIPDHVPGFGPVTFNGVKISMRVPALLEDEITASRAVGLDVLLPEATNRLGGFSDACHSLTAATTVALGKEGALIEEMEKILAQ
jgi:single-stranded-DNA-specific exonuclease